MLVPLKWLEQYVDLPVGPAEFSERLTMTGAEIEAIIDPAAEIQNVVVGKILSIEKHPDADRLLVCSMDAGRGEPVQIVTGAPNVFEGALVPVALAPAGLPGGVTINKGKIRGVASEGMLCSGQELLLDDSDYPGAGVDGILILKGDYEIGRDIRRALGVWDVAIDFKSFANRPDLLSIIGVARESAVALGQTLRVPEVRVEESGPPIDELIRIRVEDLELCPRYSARVLRNVRVGPSPQWMQRALAAAGIRPINNVVDVTNYVMLEMGQPLHAFDMAHVSGREIVVRAARPGETLVTLDGRGHALQEGMLLICDGERAIGVAGVMGGENSEIGPETCEVALESACFNKRSIRRTSRALGMRTEASLRFEKGLDIQGVVRALNRAAQLMIECCGASAARGAIDIYPEKPQPKALSIDCAKVRSLVNVDIPDERMLDILNELGIASQSAGEGVIKAVVPSHRADIERLEDIAEEVLRIYGYQHIPSTLMEGPLHKGFRTAAQQDRLRLRQTLAAWGFREISTLSFIAPRHLDWLGLEEGDPLRRAVRLLNPLGEDQSLMRTLLVPSMLEALQLNQSRKTAQSIRLFEIARVYREREGGAEDLPDEQWRLCVGVCDPSADFYTLKGWIETIFVFLGIDKARVRAFGAPYLHPGRSAAFAISGREAVHFGQIHPDTAARFGLKGDVFIADIDLQALLGAAVHVRALKPVSRFPSVERDLAVLVGRDEAVGPMIESIQKKGGALLESVELFDVYEGPQVKAGYKSVAFSLRFRAQDRTLTDDEVQSAFERIVQTLARAHGAAIRA